MAAPPSPLAAFVAAQGSAVQRTVGDGMLFASCRSGEDLRLPPARAPQLAGPDCYPKSAVTCSAMVLFLSFSLSGPGSVAVPLVTVKSWADLDNSET